METQRESLCIPQFKQFAEIEKLDAVEGLRFADARADGQRRPRTSVAHRPA